MEKVPKLLFYGAIFAFIGVLIPYFKPVIYNLGLVLLLLALICFEYTENNKALFVIGLIMYVFMLFFPLGRGTTYTSGVNPYGSLEYIKYDYQLIKDKYFKN